jgi:hypothetical protein
MRAGSCSYWLETPSVDMVVGVGHTPLEQLSRGEYSRLKPTRGGASCLV